jgi:hypothetical protein
VICPLSIERLAKLEGEAVLTAGLIPCHDATERPALFRGRHFADEFIVLFVRS